MLPPNAYWKGLLRFGQGRLRSVSSHGADRTPLHGIARKAPLYSRIPIPTGSIKQADSRRQYIAPSRGSFLGPTIHRGSHHALCRPATGGRICHRDGVHESTSRNRIPRGRLGEHDVRPATNVKKETTVTGPSSVVLGAPCLRPSPKEPSIYSRRICPLASLSIDHTLEHPALPESGLKSGDPVKRDITPSHRPIIPSAAIPAAPSSLALHKAVPALAPPSARPVIDGSEIKYQDILDGLQFGLAAILDSDVDFWVKEVVGASARRFMADMAALGELRGK
ncbi:hypothetical protein V494_01290 [Pseudogymnoascus sp. VKM F-4513 (FW-928)]|nr:hypothetical protein V494_01290 [Pseudogymnoascus sp. VKM F-4513 (FW-928)]